MGSYLVRSGLEPSLGFPGRKPLKLPDVFARPALDGKRLAGELEIHSNGVRYVSPLGGKIGKTYIWTRPN